MAKKSDSVNNSGADQNRRKRGRKKKNSDIKYSVNCRQTTARQMRTEDLERAYVAKIARASLTVDPDIKKLHAEGWLPNQIAAKLNRDLSEVNIHFRRLGPVKRVSFRPVLTQGVTR